MHYFNLRQTSEKSGLSRATIYRFYDRNPELWNETQLKSKKRIIPESHLTLLTKSNIYAKALALGEQTFQMKRLVTMLTEANSAQSKIYQLHWNFSGSIFFKQIVNEKYCYDEMQRAFDFLVKLNGNSLGLKIFFALEFFLSKNGPHVHFLLKVGKQILLEPVKEQMKKFFGAKQIDFKAYDKYDAKIYQLSKEGTRGQDWNILGDESFKYKVKHENQSHPKAI